MKHIAVCLLAMLLMPSACLAQTYYTLPEVREQAEAGWHETYTDQYGRAIAIELTPTVFGGEHAPVCAVRYRKHAIDHSLLAEGPTVAADDMTDAQNALFCAIEKLPMREREAIVLHYYQDMPAPEITLSLAIHPSSIYRRPENARKKLKKILERWGQDE